MTDYASLVARLRCYNPPDRTVDEHRQMAQDIYDAADAIEALRADALRYRWLRAYERTHQSEKPWTVWQGNPAYSGSILWWDDGLDSAIDAAMAAPPVAGPTETAT